MSNVSFDIIYNLAITKKLNFLIGSGASYGAIPLMRQCEGNNTKEKNDYLLRIVSEVSTSLINEDFNKDETVNIVYDLYYSFLSTVLNLVEKSNSRLVSKNVNLFTTNYDLFIEKVVDKLLQERRFVFNDGANGYLTRILNGTNYNTSVSYRGINDNYTDEIPSISLIKPHGSINWRKVNNKEIEITTQVQNHPVVVPPTGEEERDTFQNNHFHDMLRKFQLELDKPQSILIVFVFSFQDQHIAKMLIRALNNSELIVYIFCLDEKDKQTIINNLRIKSDKRNNLVFITPADYPQRNKITQITIKEVSRTLNGEFNE